MQSVSFVLCAVSIPLVLGSCSSPLPISKLKSVSPPSAWYFGKEVITKKKQDVKVSLAFLRSVGNDLVFDVEVTNFSSEKVLLVPQDFHYTAFQTDSSTLAEGIYAKDPASMVLNIDKQLSRAYAAEVNNTTLGLIDMTSDLVVDIVSIGKTIDEEDEANIEYDRVLRNSEREIAAYEIETNIQSLNDERNYWEFQALRKTTLPSNFSMKGSILFPRNKDAKYYSIHVPVGKDVFVFYYEQTLVRP